MMTIAQPPQVQDVCTNQSPTVETAVSGPPAARAIPTRTATIGDYTYTVTPADLQREQQAFEAGEGVHN